MAIEIEAQVTGRVVRVLARVGDPIEADAEILVLESMKMEIPVEAPSAGTLAEILVEEGDSVAEGQLLVRLD